MKINEIKGKPKEELEQQLRELKSELYRLGFDLADNKLKDVSRVKKVKKDIARVLTLLNMG